MHTYFIGIGGTGLSAIARVLIERGEKVSGSDMSQSKNTEMLKNIGAKVFTSHHEDQVIGADVVIRSSAIQNNHPEVLKAKSLGIEVLKRKEYLPKLLGNKQVIGVSGTHGKTSTTAMLAFLLTEIGIDTGYIVGGDIINLGHSAHAGESDYFVIEADEYDYMFWGLSPKIAIITNLEHDHPDCFPTQEEMDNAFEGYIDRITPEGVLIACSDDSGANRMADYARRIGKTVFTYGFNSEADYQVSINSEDESGTHINFHYEDSHLVKAQIQVIGEHNALNAAASFAALHQMDISLDMASQYLKMFKGAGRRFDILGEINKTIVVNDYGHHPTEIQTTLSGAKSRYLNRRIWAVWQPHTFSRILKYQQEFSNCFAVADEVVVLDVFASREIKPENFDLTTYIDEINHSNIAHLGNFTKSTNYLLSKIAPNDLIIVFSAGDAPILSTMIIDGLTKKEKNNE
jgi:UDP-N-acetylmuramate--alanine ligase